MIHVDARLDALERWLASQLDGAAFSLAPASEDASFRRYFRATLEDRRTYVVMDAPPEREDCRPFIRIAGLLREAGVHAPIVHAQDLAEGFLLLSDLGTKTYLAELDEATMQPLFADAVAALLRWQLATRPAALPPYDDALLRREMALFPEWYLSRHLGLQLSGAQRAALGEVESLLVASALAQPAVYVHRDFMPRNLMVSEPNPGVLDFQDAVLGPVTYDLVSLLEDSRRDIAPDLVAAMRQRYLAAFPELDHAVFDASLALLGAQRHCKVIGIFTRLDRRDHKPRYLAHIPRLWRLIDQNLRHPALEPVKHWLDRHIPPALRQMPESRS